MKRLVKVFSLGVVVFLSLPGLNMFINSGRIGTFFIENGIKLGVLPATLRPVSKTALLPISAANDSTVPNGMQFGSSEFVVVVNKIVRPANAVVKLGNKFNADAGSKQEYVQVVMTITCTRDLQDKCQTSRYDYTMRGSKGVAYEAQSLLLGINGILESNEIYGGVTLAEKSVFFLVDTDEQNLQLELVSELLGSNY